MAKQFIKKVSMAIGMTMLIVIVASGTYAYVVPAIFSSDIDTAISKGMSDVQKIIVDTQSKLNDTTIQLDDIRDSSDIPTTANQPTKEQTILEKYEQYKAGNMSFDQDYSDVTVGKVTKVIDGDTLDVDGIRIRLALVNTPESGKPGYSQATAFTRALCPVGSTAMWDVDNGQKGWLLWTSYRKGMVF